MDWRAEAFGVMKSKKIKNYHIAEHLNVSTEYISEILNGREIKDGKGSKDSILNAINEIIKKRR